MKIIAGFHTRNDEWILGKKLSILSKFCALIVVCLDRPSQETHEILLEARENGIPLEVFEHKNTLGLPENDPVRGPLCEEGAMRQEVWEAISKHSPDYVLLGDTDEIPTPDIVPFFETVQEKYPDIDHFLLPIINLYKGEKRYICGRDCVWSPEHPQANKRAAIVRFVKDRDYLPYPKDKPCHVRLEPSFRPKGGGSLATKVHFLSSGPRVLHYKFSNWERWLSSFKAGMRKYQDYWKGLETRVTPSGWLWKEVTES